MMIYVNQPPELSPWGEVRRCDQLARGVFQVTTDSHGGIMVSVGAVNDTLSRAAQQYGFKDGFFHCYEEDCEAAIALRELMDKGLFTAPVNKYFKPGEYEACINKTIQSYFPEYWEKRENGSLDAPEPEPEKMTVLLVEPGKFPQRRVVDHTMEDMQEMVGGLIEPVYGCFDDPNMCLVCNDEGLIMGLPLNRKVCEETVIAGNFFVCGLGKENFIGLSDEQLCTAEKKFHSPQIFIRRDGEIQAKNVPPDLYAALMGMPQRGKSRPAREER